MADLGVGHHLLADLLDQLADLLAVDVDRQRQVELLDHPVARGVAHRAERAVGHEVQRAVVVAQRHGAQRDALDRALGVAAALDVLADAERVLGEVEDAGDHVAHQRLGAEAERDADHAGAGEHRRDLEAERPERGQHQHHQQQHRGGDAQQRQQREQARARVRARGACRARGTRARRWSMAVRTVIQMTCVSSASVATPSRRSAEAAPAGFPPRRARRAALPAPARRCAEPDQHAPRSARPTARCSAARGPRSSRQKKNTSSRKPICSAITAAAIAAIAPAIGLSSQLA